MEIPYLRAAAVKRGAKPEVLSELEARATAHFDGKQVSDADLERFLSAHVQTWELHGMTQGDFLNMPVTWRITQGHLHHPAPTAARPRRPVTRSLTPAELDQLKQEGLTGAAYTERARQMQQTPLPEP